MDESKETECPLGPKLHTHAEKPQCAFFPRHVFLLQESRYGCFSIRAFSQIGIHLSIILAQDFTSKYLG